MKDKKQLLIAKNTVRSIINEYKKHEDILKSTIKQSLTSNYQNVIVQGGYSDGQAVTNQLLDRADSEQYMKSVEDILRVMPSTFRKIIINRYIRRMSHKEIIAKLDIDDNYYIAESTYYEWFDKSVLSFYNESMARMLEMKVGK